MRRRGRVWLFALGLPVALICLMLLRDTTRPDVPRLQAPADLVVLVVLDGVRPDELMSGPDPDLGGEPGAGTAMPHLMEKMVPDGVFLGRDTGAPGFRLGNPMGISIPSYQSIFTGRLTACVSNGCGPPLGGNLEADLADAGLSVGFFSASGDVCANLGLASGMPGVLCGTPKGPARADAETFAAALDHLQSDPPRFLYIGLEASDSVGHSGDYPRYLRVLQAYDGYLQQLGAALAASGLNATLLVTTDHGRGQGAEWTEHRWNVPGTNRLWLFAMGHGIGSVGIVSAPDTGSLYDIRATVNYLLGQAPPTGLLQGQVLSAILD